MSKGVTVNCSTGETIIHSIPSPAPVTAKDEKVLATRRQPQAATKPFRRTENG